MYFTWQKFLIFESLQVAEGEEKLPLPLEDQVTLPANGFKPSTVAVQITGLPTTAAPELHDTEV
jgi:hypothetical protein